MDPLIDSLFRYAQECHAETRYTRDMPTLAVHMGLEYRLGEASFVTPDGLVVIDRHQPRQLQRVDAAHEIAHAIADDGDYTEALRHHHASVPDMHEHLEALAEHTADRLLMPDALTEAVVTRFGFSGRAIWELAREGDVPQEQAARRLVHLRPDQRCAAFIAQGNYIWHACKQHYHLPFWVGDRVPELHVLSEHGYALFAAPSTRSRVLGFISVD